MILVAILCLTVALAGGFIVGLVAGTLVERERAARKPPPPHVPLAAVYQMPTPRAILAELRGPLPGCDYDDRPVSFELSPENRRRSSYRVVER